MGTVELWCRCKWSSWPSSRPFKWSSWPSSRPFKWPSWPSSRPFKWPSWPSSRPFKWSSWPSSRPFKWSSWPAAGHLNGHPGLAAGHLNGYHGLAAGHLNGYHGLAAGRLSGHHGLAAGHLNTFKYQNVERGCAMNCIAKCACLLLRPLHKWRHLVLMDCYRGLLLVTPDKSCYNCYYVTLLLSVYLLAFRIRSVLYRRVFGC